MSGTRTKVIEDASGGRRGRVRLGLFILEAGLHHSAARMPGKWLCGAPQRAARLPDDWGVWLHLTIIILKGIDFSSCWSAIRHLKPPGLKSAAESPHMPAVVAGKAYNKKS